MATTVGASIPSPYFSATEKCVGLVTMTSACGTASIMRARDICIARRRWAERTSAGSDCPLLSSRISCLSMRSDLSSLYFCQK